MTRPTLEQQRAQYAWKVVQEGCARGGKDYVNLAKAAPALIMNNGLMQTLAYYEDKGKDHHKDLAAHLRRWIARSGNNTDRDPGFRPFMQDMLAADSARYRQATDEALRLLRWIRQFAAAVGPNGER